MIHIGKTNKMANTPKDESLCKHEGCLRKSTCGNFCHDHCVCNKKKRKKELAKAMRALTSLPAYLKNNRHYSNLEMMIIQSIVNQKYE